MKYLFVIAAFFCFSLRTNAQNSAAPATQGSSASPDEARMKALEDQVSTLASELASLRTELQQLRGSAPQTAQATTAATPAAATADAQPGTAANPPAPPHAVNAEVPAPTQAPVAASAAPPAGTGPQTFGGASGNAKLLNPDISLIGDFIGALGRNNVSPSKSLEMHESELGVQAIIDPYARADAFISFGETGVNVEEAYVTFTSLPAGLLLKVGKKRADFGKVNTIHNHALQFIDRPLVTNNLVGGEDGINDAGFFLSRFLPAPKNWFIEGNAELLRGDSADVFTASHRQDVSVVAHIRGYRDLTESTNLDLGVSYARGHNDLGSNFLTNLYGADVTLRWKPLRRAIYNSFLFRNEFVWSARDQFAVVQPELFQTEHAFGLYSLAEYRVNRRWTVAGRFDRSGHARDHRLNDTGFSGILTYWPSEFSQIRGQYRFGRLETAPNTFSNANELLFQFLFVMGAHGAHPF